MATGAQFVSGNFQGLDNTGAPVPYGKVFFTDSFTGAAILTYKNSGLTVLNTHPVILSASGKADIFITSNQYDIVMKDQNDIVIWSMEGYTPVGLGDNPSAWRERLVAIVGQTDFIFSSPVDSSTIIFVNGALKELGASEDYIVVPPFTVKFNAGLAAGNEVVAFGAAPATAVSTMYADGSVPMDPGYIPAVEQDIATKGYVDQTTADGLSLKANLTGAPFTGPISVTKNIGASSNYQSGQLLLATNDNGDVTIGFHRIGATGCQLRHEANGLILSGTTDATAADLYVLGNIGAYSDERLKTDIVKIDNALAKVMAINGYTFKRTNAEEGDEDTRHAGVIAQEIEKVLPEVVNTDSDGFKSVAYGNIVGLLIEAIKELRAEVQLLKGV